jgi:undecaprenyl-diphosphatase
MPPDLTVFAAQHLTYVDVGLAALVLAGLLYRRRHATVVYWIIASGLMLTLSLVFSRIGSALYTDPRPFVEGHFQPLLPHTANNGFPPGHAVLAAAVVAAVLFLSWKWAIPYVILAFLIDWARVGVGIVHVMDIASAWGFVALASLIAFAIGPVTTAILLPSIPSSWTAEPFRLGHNPRDQALE